MSIKKEVICVQCNKPFSSSDARRITCSRICARKYQKSDAYKAYRKSDAYKAYRKAYRKKLSEERRAYRAQQIAVIAERVKENPKVI